MCFRRKEKRVIDNIIKHKNILFFVIISILALIIRCNKIMFISGDMDMFLIPWYKEIKENGGFSALAHQVGDYNILYQTFIACITYFDVNCVILYKAFSILFDYVLAGIIAIFVSRETNEKVFGTKFNLLYASVILWPTVVLNSSYWGQCDSIYSTFLILTLFFLYKEKFTLAFIMLGIGFAFKFQMIFIVPFIIMYYFCTNKISVIHFMISGVVFWLSGMASFLQGRELLAPFKIYANQTSSYGHMYINFPSFWMLLGDDYTNLKMFSILITLILVGTGVYLILSYKIKLITLEDYLSIAIGFLWTCLLFLPSMHERYSYSLDILLIILTCINKKYFIYTLIGLLINLITYGNCLFGLQELPQYCAVIYVLMYAKYLETILKKNIIMKKVMC